jgi:hypothetical protein
MPVIFRLDRDGQMEGLCIPQIRLEDKPKIARLIAQSVRDYRATVFVSEFWVSVPKLGKTIADLAASVPPRCDPDRQEVVGIRLILGKREVWWHNAIARLGADDAAGENSARKSGALEGWELVGDTFDGFVNVPVNF